MLNTKMIWGGRHLEGGKENSFSRLLDFNIEYRKKLVGEVEDSKKKTFALDASFLVSSV